MPLLHVSKRRFSIGRDFALPGEHRHCLETLWVVTIENVLLASSGWSPEMLLNILQCTGQVPQQRTIRFKTSIGPKLRNPGLENATFSHHITGMTGKASNTWKQFNMDTGNLEVRSRAWGNQHRSPRSYTGLSPGGEPNRKGRQAEKRWS